jgi:hypothetical protein
MTCNIIPAETYHKSSNEYRSSLLYTALFIIAYLFGIAAIALRLPCWSDECHFVGTIVQFEQEFNLHTLVHYNEMSMPLPFVLYAAWGKCVGDSLNVLRLFSLLIACATFFAFHSLFFLVLRKGLFSFLLVVFLALNPYMAGVSVFVFTDMLMMLSLALFMLGMARHNLPLLFFSSMAGLLCRQYFVFATGAGILFFIHVWILENKEIKFLRSAGVLLASMIPMVSFFTLWHGLCPDNADKSLYIRGGPQFHLNSLTLYITLVFVYSFPLLVGLRKHFYRNRRLLILSLILGFFYWLFPIVPSTAALDVNITTVGYFNRLLRIWPGKGLEHYFLFVLFTLALPVCMQIGIDLVNLVARRKAEFPLFLCLTVFSFFAVMPFSYLDWEKYFLPLLPVMALYCGDCEKRIDPDRHPRLMRSAMVMYC